MRGKVSKSSIDALRVGEIIADSNPVGFVARRLKSGTVSYGFRHRDKNGKQPWIGLGIHGVDLTPDQARKKALKIAAQIEDGDQPESAAVSAAKRRQSFGYTVDKLLDDFIARYAKDLRSVGEIKRCFDVDVRPRLGKKLAQDLRRRDIVALLDAIEDRGAPVMADRTRAHLAKALRWHASRDDTFVVPIVAGMARTKPKERARKRTLDDQEIKDLWAALETLGDTAPSCFPAFVRFLLLSAQRRGMVSTMMWSEIDGRDWIVPEAKHKGKGHGDHVVPLTDELLSLIGQRTKGYVFSSDGGRTPFSGFSKAKRALDQRLAAVRKAAKRPPMQRWTLHDLRRSARSLMSRAGVQSDHAERVLAHIIPGIRGVYDRHEYRDEKLDALEKLGALIKRILRPGEPIIAFPKRLARSSGDILKC